jgi:DNA-binding response OmpR family regulator
MNAGADDYIHKPLDTVRFLARVKAAPRRARV